MSGISKLGYFHKYENPNSRLESIDPIFFQNISFLYNERMKKNQIFDGFYKITKSRIELDLDSVPIFSHFTDQFLR